MPVLTVDTHLIHKVDTRNVENLFSMWTVFSRCAGSLEEGRRLENLSWRLWNRETFCCEPAGTVNATSPAMKISPRDSESQYNVELPELSGSVESLVDDEAIEFESDISASTTPPLDIAHPWMSRQDSASNRSRGRERHITPDDLEKMVITIQKNMDLEPLEPNTYLCLPPLARMVQLVSEDNSRVSASPPSRETAVESIIGSGSTGQSSQCVLSDSTSAVSERSTTSVVRGFSPSHVSSSYRSTPLLPGPSSTSPDQSTAPKPAPVRKQGAMFALGGSSGDDSTNEQTSPLGNRMNQKAKKKAAKFTLGASSGEDDSSLRSNMQPALPSANRSSAGSSSRQNKKETSFKEELAARALASRTIHEDEVDDNNVFESDDEDIDESAIDDEDDSSEWEDSLEESGKSSIDEKTFFQRVDSRPSLVSRRSLITTMLHQPDRLTGFRNQASMSTPAMQRSRKSPPNGPSIAGSPDSEDAAPLMMRKGPALRTVPEIPRSAAQPIIMTTTNNTAHQLALSPRTTRRNMLSTELTESLRRHLLWERQQKNQTASAVLKRRHTSYDVANLKQYPDKVHLGSDDRDGRNGSWNDTFSTGLGEYHSKGW